MVRSLYLAPGMDELQKLAALGADIHQKPIMQLCKSLNLVLKQAEKHHRIGDEENAFMFYLKYFNLINIIQKSKDFPKVRPRQREFFGTNNEMNKRLEICERLKSHLLERYAEREEQNKVRQSTEVNKENIEEEPTYKKVSSLNTDSFILCSQVYQQISKPNSSILLIDCRPAQRFEESRIICRNLINISEDGIKKGSSASMMSNKIPQSAQHLWMERDKMDLIVLIDEDTSETQPLDSQKPIWVMRDILLLWDPDKNYKSILLLEGGFLSFVITYPMYTTNPKYSQKPKDTQIYPNLGDIEYNFEENIKMKSKLPENPQYIPRIDRASKPARWSKSIDTQQPMNPIKTALEKESLAKQILEKEKQILFISNELVNTVTQSNNIDQPELIEKQTKLEYQFIQTENELNDTLSEFKSISQSEIDDKLETLQIDQNPELARLKASLEAKEREISQFEQKRSQSKQVLEAKRNMMNENHKRHLEMKEVEDELIRPKMPMIDRSSKPTFDRSTIFPQIQRDFSPVHGSYGERGTTGLANLGNTCYMNSIIQCLLNLREICEYLRKDGYQKHLNRKSKTNGQVTEELAQLSKEIWSGNYKSIAPRDFRSVVGQHHKMFASYEQQDSHEFLVILIDMLHSELEFPMDDRFISENANRSEVAWREFVKNMQSIIQNLFFGQIRSTVKCRTCGFESFTFEGFSHLSLELPQNNKQCELYDCMDLYFNGEVIDGWTCPKCKQSREAIKKLDISRMPPILVIHLKRFYASMTMSNSYEKKQNYVYFPIGDFNITDYVTPSLKKSRQPDLYNLFAVSNHYGTMNRGHYTAFCQNAVSKRWYKFDDNYVTPINSDDVNSSAGYILFYSSI